MSRKTPAKVIVTSHIFASGPTQALVAYLRQPGRTQRLMFIGHPLLPRPGRKNISFVKFYHRGKKTSEKLFRNFGTRFSAHYALNFFLTIFWVLVSGQKWDLFIGVNNLNTLSGLVLKGLGRVDRVIFYGIDFVPRRFNHPLVNDIYHWVDRIAVIYADEIWSLSARMTEARKRFRNLTVPTGKEKIVPMGIWFDQLPRVPFAEVEKTTLVFMGHLLEKQGVQVVIGALPRIIKKIPDFKLLIIGKGEYRPVLEKMVKDRGLGKAVVFTGYIEDYQEMSRVIARSACAVALYQPGDDERNFTYYTDPGKIKDYLGAGLPVILTDVPHNARELERAGCGVVVSYQKSRVAEAVIGILSDEGKLRKYRRSALDYARCCDWGKIFAAAFC